METVVSLRELLSGDGRRNPYAFYAQLHEQGPACRLDPRRDRYDLVVHGYDAVASVLRDPAFGMLDAAYMDRGRMQWRDHPALRTLYGSIFFANAPGHTRVRRQFSQVFTARRVAALEPAVVRLIEQMLDRLATLGAGGQPVDFMAELALPLPSDVIGELLGVPEPDRAWFPPRVLAIGALLELGPAIWKHLAAADQAAVELTGYFAELAAKRRAQPRDDLVSALVQAQAEQAGQLDDTELLANLITLFNAGFVTTTHLLGNGLVLLLERPEQRAALLADPELAPAYVEEILRYEPPVHFGVRRALADTEVAGLPVAAGSTALVLLGAANRDPARYPDPDAFLPSRPDNQPLSFGGGVHYCLGAALSRLEGRLALPMLLERFPRLALAGEPDERSQLVLRGYDRLYVTVE
ncbi:MAG TPA: cytochrome P450 [Micromonosporaceae bacterium]|nr:cytochrome P450 [Micromonosporaceae bacterium]